MEKTIDYDEVEKALPSQVKEMRTVLEDKYSIKVPDHCDEFIKRCLRLKDGNKEKAIKLIKTFHATTVDFHEWDATLSPSLYEDYYNIGTLTPLLKRDNLGRRIFIIRTEQWDPRKMNFDEAIAGLWLATQYINSEFTDVQRNGFVTIWDFSQFSLQQAWAVKHWRLVTLAKWIQNSVAGRIKAFHAIFHPRAIGMIYSGLKPFLKEKLRKRIIFHDSVESLHKHLSPELLPSYHLGGELADGEGIDKPLIKDLIMKDDFFKEMMDHGFPSK